MSHMHSDIRNYRCALCKRASNRVGHLWRNGKSYTKHRYGSKNGRQWPIWYYLTIEERRRRHLRLHGRKADFKK